MTDQHKPEPLGLTRGKLARLTGCNIETIRYYEQIGILPPPPRTEGGHRVYGEAHTKRLHFVRRARQLGFTLDQVRGLLELVDGGDYTCGEVHDITVAHLVEVREKIADLRKLQRILQEMAARCEGGEIPECPVIDALYQAPK